MELSVPGSDPNDWSFIPPISAYLHKAGRLYSSISTSLLPPAQFLDINVFTTCKSSSCKQFLLDLTAISDFVEKETSSEAQFGGFNIRGLYGILDEFGPESDIYITAAKVLYATLQQVSENYKKSCLSVTDLFQAIKLNIRIALLLSPPSELPVELGRIDEALEKRQLQPPQSPLPPNQNKTLPPQEPLFSTSTCFPTVDECTNSTNSCSSHGACTNATRVIRGERKTCFVCACQVTTSSTGRKEDWVGTACEKEDVSGPFVLLAGTTIGLLLITIGTIKLLTNMGNEQLPGVLTAGATGGVNHLKRS